MLLLDFHKSYIDLFSPLFRPDVYASAQVQLKLYRHQVKKNVYVNHIVPCCTVTPIHLS